MGPQGVCVDEREMIGAPYLGFSRESFQEIPIKGLGFGFKEFGFKVYGVWCTVVASRVQGCRLEILGFNLFNGSRKQQMLHL